MKTNLTLFALILVVGFGLNSCAQIKGEGPIVTKELKVEDFTGVALKGSFNVEVEQGDKSVRAKGNQNIIDRLDLEVKDGVLKVKLEKGNYRDFELTVFVSTRNITELAVAGSGDMKVGAFKALDELDVELAGSGAIKGTGLLDIGEKCEVEIAGSGDVDLEVKAAKLEVEIAGSGNVKLKGEASDQEISIAGSGDYKALDLVSEKAKVSISGSGDADLNVEKSLEVSIAGSGDVNYRGNPKVNSNVMGSGDVSAVK